MGVLQRCRSKCVRCAASIVMKLFISDMLQFFLTLLAGKLPEVHQSLGSPRGECYTVQISTEKFA